MKEIKRLFLSVGILSSAIFGLFLNCTPVHAEFYSGQAIWPSEMIANVYIKKIRSDGIVKYQQAHFMRRSEDNAFVYCLQPFVDINNNYVYQVARSDYEIYKHGQIPVYSKFSSIKYSDSKTNNVTLSKALKRNKITIEEILEKNNKIDYVNDGGSMLYVYYTSENDITTTDFYVAKCNRMNDGVTKIIFGNSPSIIDEC